MSTQNESVTVRGGAGGTVAQTEEMLHLAATLKLTAGSLFEVFAQLHSAQLRDTLTVESARDRVGALDLIEEHAELCARLDVVSDAVGHLGDGLAHAALRYVDTDDGVLTTFLRGLGDVTLGLARMRSWDVIGGSAQVWRGLPGIVDGLAGAATPLTVLLGEIDPDGRPVLHDLGADDRPAATRAPHSLADLMSGLAVRNRGHHGEVSVAFVVGADGRRRAIVDIPGTKSWDPAPNADVTSVGTDLRAMTGRATSYENGVFAALAAAGVGPDTDVMLVGHSEGGTVAVNAARDAAASGRFRITHVVTAGAPIGRIVRQLPGRVQVLALENAADVVPDTDAATNPDRPNITTVTVDDERYSISANHDLDRVYRPAAAAADRSSAVSITDFERTAHGFLSGRTLHTHAYWITRDP